MSFINNFIVLYYYQVGPNDVYKYRLKNEGPHRPSWMLSQDWLALINLNDLATFIITPSSTKNLCGFDYFKLWGILDLNYKCPISTRFRHNYFSKNPRLHLNNYFPLEIMLDRRQIIITLHAHMPDFSIGWEIQYVPHKKIIDKKKYSKIFWYICFRVAIYCQSFRFESFNLLSLHESLFFLQRVHIKV